ncbi:MAG TPA: DNA-binding protein WhiA [Candidatus Rubrimentiphilum sp.]|nr:DNA-binding protein WhiA [Candidatus Rubrimentiphilum sp.]
MRNLSADTKDALARNLPAEAHCRDALLAGLILYGTRSISKRTYFVTHRNAVARLLLKLSPRDARFARSSASFDRLRMTPDKLRMTSNNVAMTKRAQRIAIPVEPERARKPVRKCDRVMEARAAFLTCGSVSAGTQGYHLEFVPPPGERVQRLEWILRAVAGAPKKMSRGGRATLYYKDFEAIVEFFGVTGAHNTVLELEGIHALKETKNRIHRLVNTEAANLERVAGAAAAQREIIDYVSSAHGLRHLSAALREIAELRINYPDESLAELGRRCRPPISKPAAGGRLNALARLARRLRGESGSR